MVSFTLLIRRGRLWWKSTLLLGICKTGSRWCPISWDASGFEQYSAYPEELVDGNTGNLVPQTVVSAMVYDEAGQLKTKYLHSQSNRVFLQKVDYRYNIRGWLTGINDPGLEAPESDQFGMTLYYNRGNRGGSGYYNGNIQGETWGITSYLNQVNSYTYDKLNRITGSRFGAGNAYRSYYTYDNNGNIQKLLRKAEDGVAFIDSIFYGYKINSNQLDYTRDDAGNAPGWDFPGTLLGSNHYQYDANGNMTRDDYKASNVSYNSFNLPSEIDFGNNQKLNYYYDGSCSLDLTGFENLSGLRN